MKDDKPCQRPNEHTHRDTQFNTNTHFTGVMLTHSLIQPTYSK